MKKSELKELVQECYEEILSEGYTKDQVNKVIRAQGDNSTPLRLQIAGEYSSTKWLNITLDEAKKIAKILK